MRYENFGKASRGIFAKCVLVARLGIDSIDVPKNGSRHVREAER